MNKVICPTCKTDDFIEIENDYYMKDGILYRWHHCKRCGRMWSEPQK
jgi:hypothetical protein